LAIVRIDYFSQFFIQINFTKEIEKELEKRYAAVVELVDTTDLKSVSPNGE
jgi:hypothetical protein